MGSTFSYRSIQLLFVVLLSVILTIAGGTANAETASDSDAQGASAAAEQLECGTVTCSYVFSKAVTNDIATGGAASAACAAIPTPGNVACGIGFASLIVTANSAKNRNECAKITWTKIPPPPTGTWWPSIDGSSRCS
jgi:hypothetical protein